MCSRIPDPHTRRRFGFDLGGQARSRCGDVIPQGREDPQAAEENDGEEALVDDVKGGHCDDDLGGRVVHEVVARCMQGLLER